jgi:hypothetical protein
MYENKKTEDNSEFIILISGTFPIESFAQDHGRTLVRAEYGNPKGFPNTNN